MLTGTADLTALAAGAPTIREFRREPLLLEGVEILQMTFEAESSAIASLLPSGLHPTIPPLVTWLGWRCRSGPLGAFTLAQTRISCRSGVRPRAFLVGAVIDDEAAGRRLEAEWGYRCRTGDVALRRGYDRISLRVAGTGAGSPCLEVSLLDPDPLGESDIQYTANMNLAHTPRGLRLVQVDPEMRVQRAERGRPRLDRFDGEAWGVAGLRPAWAVSASFAIADLTLPRIRYLCRADVSAFAGTESVAEPA